MNSSYDEKFELAGEDKVRENLELGLYAERRAKAARMWLRPISPLITDHPVSKEPVIVQQNIIFVIAGKSKILKWVLSKIGKGNLIEGRK